MKKKTSILSKGKLSNSEELQDDISFSSLFDGVKPVKHDRHELSHADRIRKLKQRQYSNTAVEKKANALFEFSDGFEARFSTDGPLKYVAEGERSDRVKQLKKGEIAPELLLDLHGLNAEAAKSEIAALLFEAHRKHYTCVCIMHGIGTGTLKRKIPSWLIQHPYVLGFHQATMEWGGKSALLVLIKQSEEHNKYD
ncbi:MAG: DNA-nicking Smr family endonuclease [Glaciecola sp.]|jgi:DNA-nicking Smr family endonuclease